MDKNRFLSGSKRIPGLLVINVLFIAVIAGCDVVENTEGEQTSLCLDYFQQCINPIINNPVDNCASAGCHLDSSAFQVELTGNLQSFDSTQGVGRSGTLLTRPQDPSHPAGIIVAFTDPTNGCVQEIRKWLQVSVTETPTEQQFTSPAACQIMFPCVRDPVPGVAAQC
jgi:uncharacterized protein YwbE